MNIFYYVTLFVFGLAVGSFLNVISLRYQPARKLFNREIFVGRSHCPFCQRALLWYELMPILSFFIQRGRCRSCGHKLTWQYPLVELASGLIFVSVPFYLKSFYHPAVGPIIVALIILWVLIFLIWLLISLIDFRHMVIPNGLNLSLAILGVAISGAVVLAGDSLPVFSDSFLRHYRLIFSPFESFFLNRLFGALGVALVFWLLVSLSRGRAMGMGDVKLAAASGLVLGWPDIGLAAAVAFIVGGVWGLFLLLTGQKTLKDAVPFGPLLILGMAVTFFFGFKLIESYFSFFSV